MSTDLTVSRQWSSRPDDQRFVSLDDLLAHCRNQKSISRQKSLASRKLSVAPLDWDNEHKSLVVLGATGEPSIPSHWSFGQLATRVGAPAGYLRTLPAEIAADNLNYGLFARETEDIGVLVRENGQIDLAAVTGPNYGRVWNADVVKAVYDRFNGTDFVVPGPRGRTLEEITKRETTLYASDRDLFVFLADQKNKIELPNRRDGKSSLLCRGFYVSNSEVGAGTLSISTFYYDEMCENRYLWGVTGKETISIRHTSGAPTRFIEQVAPAIEAYADKSTAGVLQLVEDAKAKRIEGDNLDDFLAKRFTKSQVSAIKLAHEVDEDRPIENVWDAVVGATAYARGIQHQDQRVAIEKVAGALIHA
jgi:hypothetical protein